MLLDMQRRLWYLSAALSARSWGMLLTAVGVDHSSIVQQTRELSDVTATSSCGGHAVVRCSDDFFAAGARTGTGRSRCGTEDK